MVVRRGEAEVRRLDRVEGLVRDDEAAGGGFLEEMGPAALDDGGSVHRGGGGQLPDCVRLEDSEDFLKEREIEDGSCGNALRGTFTRPSPAGEPRREPSRPKRILFEGRRSGRPRRSGRRMRLASASERSRSDARGRGTRAAPPFP